MARNGRKPKASRKTAPWARADGEVTRELAEQTREALDAGMVGVLTYPLRVHILAAIARRPLSPVEIAKERDIPVSTVAYHFRVLSDCDCIELSETVPRRGALEHVYEATWRVEEMTDLLESTRQRIIALEAADSG